MYVQVSSGTKEPVSIVVEEWEESQEGAKDGGEEEESMDVSFSEPVDEPANPKLFERHLVVCVCVCVCMCACVRVCTYTLKVR